MKKIWVLSSIILWSVAEYCDYSTKLTIKCYKKEVRTELWTSSNKEIVVTTKKYLSYAIAYKEYKLAIADAILGGWQVLNALPKRETWETKRSK